MRRFRLWESFFRNYPLSLQLHRTASCSVSGIGLKNIFTSTKLSAGQIVTCEQEWKAQKVRLYKPDGASHGVAYRMEPITDICVVQEAKNAPQGYSVIELTGDVGQDADLWKDKGLFFGRKETRYLCFARKFSLDCVESVSVQVTPPPNVLTISLTRDTGQKCLRKRYLCYTVVGRDIRNSSVISDIGVFSKTTPDGFTLAGELNGLLIAYKTIKINVESNGPAKMGGQSVDQTTLRTYKNSADGRSVAGESTACAKNWIDDIPYQLNAQLLPITRLPVIHLKTASQIYSQFNYDFSLEREILRATPPQDFSSPPNFPGENNGLVDVE